MGADAANRLVQRHVKLAPDADRLSVHSHLVMDRINFRPKLADGPAIDGDAPVQDELFRRAPRSHAGLGQKLLQTNVQSAERGARSAENLTTRGFYSALRIPNSAIELDVGLRFAETGDTVAVLPLAALLEKFGALEALEDIALAAELGYRAQTAML